MQFCWSYIIFGMMFFQYSKQVRERMINNIYSLYFIINDSRYNISDMSQ